MEVTINRGAEGRTGRAFVGDITEEKAVQLASKVVSEGFVYTVSAGGLDMDVEHEVSVVSAVLMDVYPFTAVGGGVVAVGDGPAATGRRKEEGQGGRPEDGGHCLAQSARTSRPGEALLPRQILRHACFVACKVLLREPGRHTLCGTLNL
jgi:hypothetical protein